jgi:hypothetical protein
MIHSLLSIEYSDFLIPAIIGLIIWFFLLRASVRADKIVKNQEAMIWFMILQCQKLGASNEEINRIKKVYEIGQYSKIGAEAVEANSKAVNKHDA